MSAGSYDEGVRALREVTGVVVPTYLPENPERALQVRLLEETVRAFLRELGDPSHLVLSADGEDCGADVVRELARHCGCSAVVHGRNLGKLHAVRLGARLLLESSAVQYVAVADNDGDHFANELLNLVRCAQHASREGAEALVIGGRLSRHRPMGFLRGEQEELACRVLLDALRYDAALTGRPLRLDHVLAVEDFPDFHSGYKLFTRAAATAAFLREPVLAGTSETCYYRHACEAAMVVEALQGGAVLASVLRSTFNEQPVSTFGRLDRSALAADMISWPLLRLKVPASFARVWLDNHISRLQLGTLAPLGRGELFAIRRQVLAAYGEDTKEGPLPGPLFV